MNFPTISQLVYAIFVYLLFNKSDAFVDKSTKSILEEIIPTLASKIKRT